ncbi:MAG: two-component regulator propeller domain-containing protein [Arachidicoccus sp.]|nr:two-component regulator propeller domain-containing protein [Arachidicoccus sp.]
MCKFFAFVASVFFLITSSKAQNDSLSLTNIDVTEGLSNNSVTCLLQDKYGFMWMGTYDGLNRYDSYEFKVFRNKWQDSTSLINNHIVALKENNAHSIWVGTLKGLSLFDYNNLQFHRVYYLPFGEKKAREIDSRVKEIEVDENGNAFIATEDNGLLVLRKSKTIFEQIAFNHLVKYNASAICLYKDNMLLLFIKNKGLYIFNLADNSIRLLSDNINDATKLLYLSKQNNLLIGTENGLFEYSITTNQISYPYLKFTHSNITNLLQDKGGNIWISTDGDGLAEVCANGNKVCSIVQSEDNNLKSNAVYAVYEDNNHRKWIATLRGGVSIINEKPDLFHTIKRDLFAKNTLVSNFALSFCEDEKNNIWIGTDGGGLSYWNPATNTFTNYTHHPNNPKSLSSNYVVSILRDYKNRLWVASFSGGIDLFNRVTNDFIHYPCYNPIRRKYNINLWKLYEDSHHHIWAGSTKDDALFLFNESKNEFELFDNSLTNIHTLYEDSKSNLWAGNYNQLIKIDTLYKHHLYINTDYPVRAIIEDKNHQLWVGTEGGGLMLYNAANKTFKHYTEADGLQSNSVLNIIEDAEGNLWCSTFNGLSKLDILTHSFTNFSANDGLQSNQFNYNAALKLSDGELLFGGVGGFNKFNPEAIKKIIVHPPLLITDFKINDVPIENTPYLKYGYTPVDVESVSIPFNKATLSISFAGLGYSAPGSLVYSYFLEGWDKNWSYVSKTRIANYSRLYEGNYTLHIKATNVDGSWSGKERIIHIKILPPWYRTWWAYFLYTLAFASAIYFYLKYKQRQTKLEYEMKLTRMNAEAEKELTERKISFFTNISHEFRTMLTLIINPVKEMMRNVDEDNHPEEIKTVYKNSRRMLSLAGQLLMFRKADVEQIELDVRKINLSHLTKEVYDSFAYQARIKNINYKLSCENECIFVYGDYEKLEIALFNLLSNAMKYTPEKGRIELKIEESDETVKILIADSGQGIPKETGEKVFKKYYQIHSLESHARTGFGIGLFLVKDFIDKHQGQISFTSEIGKGTTFTIELKKGKAHFGNIQIVESETTEKGIMEDILPEDELTEAIKVGVVPDKLPEQNELLVIKKKILIADDNEEIRNYVKTIFEKDFKIIEADNGKIVVEKIKKYLPDLVILDLVMPGMYGDEICGLIKNDENFSHIPVIMLTAEVSSEVKLRCVESGADDYIIKPFEKELLIARVNNLLKIKNNLQKYFYNEITLQQNNQYISPEDKEFLDKCIFFVEEHLDDDQFEIKKLADEMYMSHSNLYKKIHHISGYSVSGFVRFVRLRKAAELFINTTNNVNETAIMVGFNDVKYFRTQFQKLFGLPPSAYIKKYRKPFQKSFSLGDSVSK